MAEGTRFMRVIPEGFGPARDEEHLAKDPLEVRRVVLCSGKVYYDLQRARALNQIGDVVIVRVEQLCLFPFDLVKEEVDHYPNAELLWCQEEHKNMGGWGYVRPRIETATGKRARYTGRATAASTATGFKYTHINELHSFLADALVSKGAEVDRIEGGFPVWKATV